MWSQGGVPVGLQGDTYLFGEKLGADERNEAYTKGDDEVTRLGNLRHAK